MIYVRCTIGGLVVLVMCTFRVVLHGCEFAVKIGRAVDQI
jgi:hypothetical protein